MYTHYLRAGQPVAVWLAESAWVAPRSDVRSTPTGGWSIRSLSASLDLHVRSDVDDAAAERGTSLADAIVGAERPRRDAFDERAERSASTIDRTDVDIDPYVVAERTLWPVAIVADADTVLYPTGEIIIELPLAAQHDVATIAHAVGCEVDRSLTFIPGGWVLRARAGTDVYRAAIDLAEVHRCSVAHPVFVEELGERFPPPTTTAPTPSTNGEATGPQSLQGSPALPAMFGNQWHLDVAGVIAAWRRTLGSTDIVVAVVDSGVNEAHECFGPGRFVEGYDFADGDDDPSPSTSSHGTACAALVAAGSPTSAIVGVAPGVRLMPIRRGSLASHLAVAEALVWATEHGADIITCSFGYDGRPWVLPDVVRGAFAHITTTGRDGKGTAIFWAAGNGDESISTDEWASSSHTISIGAVGDDGRRASYSDVGPELDLMAPSSGGRRGIATAVNLGYTTSFGGTSAAAPIAAGVAALVLSVAPELTAIELRQLLIDSATTAAGDSRSGHDHEYGHGVVNAAGAIDRINVAEQLLRSIGLVDRQPDLDAMNAWLATSEAGRHISILVAEREWDLLLLANDDNPLHRSALAVAVTGCADIGAQFSGGTTPSVSADLVSALHTVASAITNQGKTP